MDGWPFKSLTSILINHQTYEFVLKDHCHFLSQSLCSVSDHVSVLQLSPLNAILLQHHLELV